MKETEYYNKMEGNSDATDKEKVKNNFGNFES